MQLLSDMGSASAAATATEPDPRNLIINYIPTPVTDAGLRKLFEPFGTIESARVIVDRVTNHPKGYGFVKYTTEDAAKRAMQKMNGYEIGNKRLRVTRANGPQNRTQPPPPPPQAPHGLSMYGLVGNMNNSGGGGGGAGAGCVGIMGGYTVSSATGGNGGGDGSHNLTDTSNTLPPPPLFSSQLWSYVQPATFASSAMLPTSTGTTTCAATSATSTAATAPLPPPPPPPPSSTTTTTMPPFLTPGYTVLGANGQLYRGPFFATTATGMPAMFLASPAGVTAPLPLLTQQQQQQQQLQQQLALLSAAPTTMGAGLSAPLLYKMDGTPVKMMDNGMLQPVFAPYQVNNNNATDKSGSGHSNSGGGGSATTTTSAANKSAGDYSGGNAEATVPLSASTLNILSSFGLPANFLSYGGVGGNAAVVSTSPVGKKSTSDGNGGYGSDAGKAAPAIGRTNSSNNNNEDDGSGNNDGTSDGVSVSASAASPVTMLRPLCFAPFQPGSPLNEVMQQSGYQVSMGASSLSMLNSGYSCDMTPPTHMQSSAMVLPTSNGNKACGNNNNNNASSDLVTLM